MEVVFEWRPTMGNDDDDDGRAKPLLDPSQYQFVDDGGRSNSIDAAAAAEGEGTPRVDRSDTFDNVVDDRGMPVPLFRMNTYDEPPPKPNSGESTLFQLIMNFVNTVVGAGIVGLPFVFKLCGFYLGLIELGVICLITT